MLPHVLSRVPVQGGYAVACGLDQLAEMIETFRFSADDIAYLASLEAPGGGSLFDERFLRYLADFELDCDVDAVREGPSCSRMSRLCASRAPSCSASCSRRRF